jgi:hypothetical protein
MWRELIAEHHGHLEPIGDVDPGLRFFPGATVDEIRGVEQKLDVKLPDDLRDLLSETNGVYVNYGERLIWDTHEIVRRNLELRSPAFNKNMPFDHLLFFGDLATGDIQFAYGVAHDDTKFWHVYEWRSINDSRVWVAQSLKRYVEWQLGIEWR